MINMNRSTSTDPYASPFMSFAALPLHSTWEPNPNPNSSYNYSSFLPDTPFLDPTPPLMPIASFPFAAADYSVKAEEEQSIGGIGVGRIGLNLGHRTYFSSGDAAAIDRLFARSRGVYALAHQPPRCQAEGCKADLSGAKHYHRRHKVCEFHSKATVVIAGGLQQRFCQQCSRFHVLSEFDEAKRSCRKRLADHNRRRRKPQPQPQPQASSDPSAPKNHSTNSSEKIKQPSRTTKVITSSNKPTNLSTSITRGSTSMEGQQGYQNRGSHMRNGPALSLGGVGRMDKGGLGCQNLYQNQVTFVSQQLQQPQQQQSFSSPSASSNTCFHSHNLLCSTSSGGGGSEHQHQQSNANLLHLGQAMFEVDFM